MRLVCLHEVDVVAAASIHVAHWPLDAGKREMVDVLPSIHGATVYPRMNEWKRDSRVVEALDRRRVADHPIENRLGGLLKREHHECHVDRRPGGLLCLCR